MMEMYGGEVWGIGGVCQGWDEMGWVVVDGWMYVIVYYY